MENRKINVVTTIDNFYNEMQKSMMTLDEEHQLRYITSSSTEDTAHHINVVTSKVLSHCLSSLIPTKIIFLKKSDLSIKAFKYLVCNTNFSCQSLLAEDSTCGYLVDLQPPFSPYLFVNILWHLNYEDILAESILHFPLDLCVEILEVLPRCIDLLNFERSSKFLITLIHNTYKKLLILRNIGSQTDDITGNTKRLAGNLQELILQFTNERFLRIENISKLQEKYKRNGILLKSIIQLVKMCLTSKFKNLELSCEMENMYKLTFGRKPFQTIDDSILQELLIEIDRELINVLLKKVKEIDCNIYLNWTEYDDEENTSLTLQRAIGLECYFFIQSTQELKISNIKEYDHLVECLQQISSKPDPENIVENLQLVDLCQGVQEGKLEYLMILFRRFKEWDNTTVDVIDSNIALLDKTSCEELLEHLAVELNHPELNVEKLQLYIHCLAKVLFNRNITELFEITIKSIMKFSEKYHLDNALDITKFESFIMLNPNFSSAKNLRVVLFFLCLKTRVTLKILLKMAIGHLDYPDVAITLEDLMLLQPILKIQVPSEFETIIQSLKIKCSKKNTSAATPLLVKEPQTISLIVRILQEICLDVPKWNMIKFSNLLQFLYTFCKSSDIVKEVFTLILLSNDCSIYYLKCILVELQKLGGRFDQDTKLNLILALRTQASKILIKNEISRYAAKELLTMIGDILFEIEGVNFETIPSKEVFFTLIFLPYNIHLNQQLKYAINLYDYFLQCRMLNAYRTKIHLVDDVIRHLMLKCTKKQYLLYLKELIQTNGEVINWRSKIEICDNFIRLTLETCKLCLEYPEVATSHTFGYLLRCLTQFLPNVISTSQRNSSYKKLCKSLITNVMIFNDIIGYTVLKDAYKKMLNQYEQSESNLEILLNTLNKFALLCIQKSEELKYYDAPHSPLGIKLWLAYNIVNDVFEKGLKDEEFFLNEVQENHP